MLVCKNCGNQINIVGRECPHCHASIMDNSTQAKKNSNVDYDCRSNSLMVGSFLVPIFGYVYFFMKKDESPMKAGSAMQGAMGGTIVALVFIVIIMLANILK